MNFRSELLLLGTGCPPTSRHRYRNMQVSEVPQERCLVRSTVTQVTNELLPVNGTRNTLDRLEWANDLMYVENPKGTFIPS